MTTEEYINRPMDGDRVANALMLLWATNYDDQELKEWYENGIAAYEELWEKQQIKRAA